MTRDHTRLPPVQPLSTIAPATLEELAVIRQHCVTMLRRRATLSAVAAAVPVPGADALADVAMMLEILPKISGRFGLSAEQIETLDPKTAAFILGAIQSLGPSLIGRVITKTVVVSLAKSVGIRLTAKQAAKYAPIIGTAGAAALGYTAFMQIGKRHIEQCVFIRSSMLA